MARRPITPVHPPDLLTPPLHNLEYESPRPSDRYPNAQAIGARLLWRLFLVLSFGLPLISAAGHDIVPLPIALILVMGDLSEWNTPILFGWGGIVLFLVGSFSDRKPSAYISILGMTVLGTSWLMFFSVSEGTPLTLIMSIPFLILWLLSLMWLCLRMLKR